MPSENESPEDKPPYLSLTTLLHFFDRWAGGPIPPRIDKSALDNYSGGTQTVLLSTLRLMGYVDSEGWVLQPLRDAVQGEDARKAHLTGWAYQFYGRQLELAAQGATAQMLHESFAGYGYSGSTLRKAVVFYLGLVEYLGLPNSPHFRAPRQTATPTSRRRPRVGPARPTPVMEAVTTPATPGPSQRGEVTTIRIGELATITVIVDAQWMKLPVKTITSMRDAIANLEALGQEAEGES